MHEVYRARQLLDALLSRRRRDPARRARRRPVHRQRHRRALHVAVQRPGARHRHQFDGAGARPCQSPPQRPRGCRQDQAPGAERHAVGQGKFGWLTCNPPFVAFPPALKGTIFARGTDVDGLGYLRAIIERLPETLTPGGTACLVADLVGDRRGPPFVGELETYARKERLEIDVYIDNVIPAEHQIPAFVPFLQRLNPICSHDEIVAEMRKFQRDVLRVENYFMSTIRLRTDAADPGVRVMRRFALTRPAAEDAWPALLS